MKDSDPKESLESIDPAKITYPNAAAFLPWGIEPIDVHELEINESDYDYEERIGDDYRFSSGLNFFVKAYGSPDRLLIDSWVIEARDDPYWGTHMANDDWYSYCERNPWYYEFNEQEIKRLALIFESSSFTSLVSTLDVLAEAPTNEWSLYLWMGNPILHTKLLEEGFLPYLGDGSMEDWQSMAFIELYDRDRVELLLRNGMPVGEVSAKDLESHLRYQPFHQKLYSGDLFS